MIEALLGLPPHVRERLAVALESGLLSGSSPTAALQSVLGSAEWTSRASQALIGFAPFALSGSATAAWIRSLGKAESRSPRADLVWSGPEVPGVHARSTRRVYEELIASAQSSLWISTYAFFDGPRAFETLARRMDAAPGMRATLLLNVQRKNGDKSTSDQLVRRFAERFWTFEWPGTSRPRIYFDSRALELDGPGGVLHAKAVVADDEAVFVTSANLTEAALDRNIELGLLVRDRTIAASVSSHFLGLIERSLLTPLPQA
jgi:phosphatidylserine/phosphatidylglycerophosphate/cardiolipin synthase-like enzyme